MRSELAYHAYLSYCPRSHWASAPSRDLIQAESWMRALKRGYRSESEGEDPYRVLARELAKDLRAGRVEPCFGDGRVALVPVPRSSLAPERGPFHWPARSLCSALVAAGLAVEVVPLLKRTTALEKSSLGGARGVQRQQQTLLIAEHAWPDREVVLVDDVITSGASMMGCALVLEERFPNIELLAGFAAMRTVSSPTEFTSTRAPSSGRIVLRAGGACQRRP